MGRVIVFPIVWLIFYFIIASIISIPFAFAFWDNKIFIDSVFFWNGSFHTSLIKVLSFMYSFIIAVVAMATNEFEE